MNVVDERMPFLGLIEHTNLVPAERYLFRYLYVSNYADRYSWLMSMTLDEALAHVLPGLARVRPGFGLAQVRRAWLFREDAAQPVPSVASAGPSCQ